VAALIHMDIVVMDLLMAANNITIPNLGTVTLRHITPIPLERQVMVIHITQATQEHTATNGKIIRSQANSGGRGPQNRFLTAVGQGCRIISV
jgi:hypothetical protein